MAKASSNFQPPAFRLQRSATIGVSFTLAFHFFLASHSPSRHPAQLGRPSRTHPQAVIRTSRFSHFFQACFQSYSRPSLRPIPLPRRSSSGATTARPLHSAPKPTSRTSTVVEGNSLPSPHLTAPAEPSNVFDISWRCCIGLVGPHVGRRAHSFVVDQGSKDRPAAPTHVCVCDSCVPQTIHLPHTTDPLSSTSSPFLPLSSFHFLSRAPIAVTSSRLARHPARAPCSR